MDWGYDFAGGSKYTYIILVCSHLENSDLETGKVKETQFMYKEFQEESAVFREDVPQVN